MSIEWKLKTCLNFSFIDIDLSVNIGSEQEKRNRARDGQSELVYL